MSRRRDRRRRRRAATLMVLASMFAPPPALAGERAIPNVPNAEDLAPIDSGRWVIASSMAGGAEASGALYVIDRESSEARRAYPHAAETPVSAHPGCPGEVPADRFAPHGIATHRSAEGEERLYVVNHGGRESIELFEIARGHSDDEPPGLRWIGCIPFPAGAFGNGVSVADDGTVFATNMGKPLSGGEARSEMGGDALSWQAERGWRTVPGSVMWGPNGVVATPNGKRLFVAAWPAGKMVALDLEANRRREVALPFLPDNIKWSTSGTLLATGHRTSDAAVRECYMSKRTACDIPSSLAEIDPDTLEVLRLRELDADIATTAVDVGDECWLGTARGETIARLPGPCGRE